MRKYFVIFIILLFGGVNSLAQEAPQTQTSLGVDPAILEVILDPNIPSLKTITLTNLSNLPQPVKTLKMSFTPDEKLNMTPEQAQVFDASSWISISADDTDFILQPNESKKITLTITQPENAAPGGHYATVIFQPLIPQELISQQSIFVYGRVASLIFMQTKGDIVQKLEYVKTDRKNISETGNLSFNIVLRNSGNTHIQPSGTVTVRNDITGQILSTVDFPSLIILPGTEKTFPVDISIGNTIGRFSVETSITYGADSIVLTSPREGFFIAPYTIIIFVVIPATVFILLGIKYRSRLSAAINVLIYNRTAGNSNKSMFKPRPHIRFRVDKKR